MRVEEKELSRDETEILERKKVGKLPKKYFEGFGDQKHISSEVFILPPQRPIKHPIELPEAIRIYRLHKLESEKYALRKVLFLQIEKTEDGEAFIAKVPQLDIFGLGKTEGEAVRDFELSLVEDYEIMREERDRLSDYLHRHFELLTKIIRELPCR